MSYEFTSLNETSDEPTATPAEQSWDASMAALRNQFPKASEGILFCVFKLQQSPDLTIKDFRDEAALHGIKIGGRAIHSAKVLLGMEKPSIRRTARDMASLRSERSAPVLDFNNGDSVENSLISAVQQIQEAATSESRRLRTGISMAIQILQRALDGRDLDDTNEV